MVLSWFAKKTHEGEGGRVPTDPRGELTESKLRVSKKMAKRRLQEVLTKSKHMRRHFAELCESDTKSKNMKRHFAELFESDILQNAAKATKMDAKLPHHR